MKRSRTPRKLKKRLKKQGLYEDGGNLLMCGLCQKQPNGYGYDCWLCKDCNEK